MRSLTQQLTARLVLSSVEAYRVPRPARLAVEEPAQPPATTHSGSLDAEDLLESTPSFPRKSEHVSRENNMEISNRG